MPSARPRGRPSLSLESRPPRARWPSCNRFTGDGLDNPLRVLRYRYLFSQLVRRELRQKYKGSALGVLWYFVNPLVLMALYGLMLRSVLKAVSYPDYPIFILAGLVVWL